MDFETALTDGTPSTDFYRHDFRVISTAISYYGPNGEIKSKYVEGEDDSRKLLEMCGDTPLIAHNLPFDKGVAVCRFPDIKSNWKWCTQRLVQNWDGSGKPNYQKKREVEDLSFEEQIDLLRDGGLENTTQQGLSLEASISRILPIEYHNHKKPYHDWIRENVSKQGKPGQFLTSLPPDMLEAYNIADTECTLRLFTEVMRLLKESGFNPEKDHGFYLSTCDHVISSKIRGVLVDRHGTSEFKERTVAEVQKIDQEFRETFKSEIAEIEQENYDKIIASKKQEKTKEKWKQKLEEDPSQYILNLNSGLQKQRLFMGKLGLKPKFLTKKGNPSFAAAHMPTWGKGGKILATRSKKVKLIEFSDKLLTKSEYDGRVHLELKVAATRNNRLAGAGGYNVQALPVKVRDYMSNLKADPGKMLVGSDGVSAEPTVISHYTNDPMYRYFCFDGIGKKPFYDNNGTLMIDYIYFGFGSRTPMFAEPLKEAFHTTWKGVSFADQWMDDKEVIKNDLSYIKGHCKWICLALGYGMSKKGIYPKCIEAELDISHKMAMQTFDAYWNLFKGIKNFKQGLEREYSNKGAIETVFGFRLTPPKKSNIFNSLMQGTVSGLFHLYDYLMMKGEEDWLEWVTCIHDSSIFQFPIEREQQFLEKKEKVTKIINEKLKWRLPVRFDYAAGSSFADTK